MDLSKIGKVIKDLRTEKNMTQKELADAMNISDRTVSKWERGIGCPDVSLLNELSQILGLSIENILAGDLSHNDNAEGNMGNVTFYICSSCENVLFSINEAEISCCGRKLVALSVAAPDENHKMTIDETGDDYYIIIDHEMIKSHYISFIAIVSYDRVLLIKFFPEQSADLHFPKIYGIKLFAYCTIHGLWEM